MPQRNTREDPLNPPASTAALLPGCAELAFRLNLKLLPTCGHGIGHCFDPFGSLSAFQEEGYPSYQAYPDHSQVELDPLHNVHFGLAEPLFKPHAGPSDEHGLLEERQSVRQLCLVELDHIGRDGTARVHTGGQ